MFSTSPINPVNKSSYPTLIQVWEASVRATHHFLTEKDILDYRHKILTEYFDMVDLYAYKMDGEIVGFIGLNGNALQMLFVHPDAMGKGVGKQLLKFAVNKKKISNVDVNEQNEKAVGFYKYFGFEVVNRFAMDNAGKPYPILEMWLNKTLI
ncbi:MAG: GNAT family N-acetyltransferase [Pedobacter sp.]|nr:MAG: GNAT family N-acetyltransferase [Pedobacter sp.]